MRRRGVRVRGRATRLAFGTGWSHDKNLVDGYAYFSARTFVDCAHARVGYRQSADLLTGAYARAADGRVLSYAGVGVIMQNDSTVRATPRRMRCTCGATRRCDRRSGSRTTASSGVRYTGTFVDERTGHRFPGTVTASIAGFAVSDGWSVACERCAARRAVTLAVGSGAPIRPGAYVGIDGDGDGAARAPVEPWQDSVEDRFVSGPAGDARSYERRPFCAEKQNIVKAPADAPSRPAFLIRMGSPAETSASGSTSAKGGLARPLRAFRIPRREHAE